MNNIKDIIKKKFNKLEKYNPNLQDKLKIKLAKTKKNFIKFNKVNIVKKILHPRKYNVKIYDSNISKYEFIKIFSNYFRLSIDDTIIISMCACKYFDYLDQVKYIENNYGFTKIFYDGLYMNFIIFYSEGNLENVLYYHENDEYSIEKIETYRTGNIEYIEYYQDSDIRKIEYYYDSNIKKIEYYNNKKICIFDENNNIKSIEYPYYNKYYNYMENYGKSKRYDLNEYSLLQTYLPKDLNNLIIKFINSFEYMKNMT